jgi:adenylate cyclase
VKGTPSQSHLAAIVNGDVAGYARLMAEDEESTARLFAEYRAAIEEGVRTHRGQLIDFTGDNFLGEMPSISEALAFGIEIQRALRERNAGLPAARRIEFRIGIHLGDLHSDGERVYGQGVNVAARLQQLAQPGHLCISKAVHDVAHHRIDVRCEDLGLRRVKNDPEPVHAFHVDTNGDPGPPTHHPVSRRRRQLRNVLLVTAALMVLLPSAVWATWPLAAALFLDGIGLGGPPQHPDLPPIPSIVVLPFDDLSPDPEHDFFAEGLTEALTTKLAGLRQIFVISRSSAYVYQDRSVPVSRIGRELGVRYVLEGSVQRAEGRVRITAQLIDAPTDFHVWSASFDREVGDVFALQSEITEQILRTLEVKIREAEVERIRRTPTEDLSAYDAFVRGESLFLRFTRAGNEAARELLQRAVDLDPEFAQAQGLLAGTYQAAYALEWDPRPRYLEIARKHALRAIQLDPMLSQPHRVMAHLYGYEERWDDALREARLAVELAPNDELAHITYFRLLANQGDLSGAVESTRRALRLNPRSPSISWASLAFIHAAVGNRKRAAELLEQVREANPDVLPALAFLAYYYQDVGRHGEAARIVDELHAVNPDLTAEMTLHWLRPLAPTDDLLSGLRRAGLD